MKTFLPKLCPFLLVALTSFALTVLGEEKAATSPVAATATTAPMSAPSQDEMMNQMAAMGKLNENHKLLGELAGNWTYTVKFWMNGDPTSKPQESKGTATRKPLMGGRFYELDVAGKMQMPGPDGKMKDFDFKGMGLEGYDNAKQKFTSNWVDNMGTGMLMSLGTYDPATKTFTYTGEVEMMAGMKTPIREVIKVTDKDHHVLEWYENRGGNEVKTMEISYTRKK